MNAASINWDAFLVWRDRAKLAEERAEIWEAVAHRLSEKLVAAEAKVVGGSAEEPPE